MLPCKGTQMFVWARKTAMKCGICLPLGGVGVFQVNRANSWGAGQGKVEDIQGLERIAIANVGKLEGPDSMGFHGTVTESAKGVFEHVLRGWEPSPRGNWMRKMELLNLLMLWTLSLTQEQSREPGFLVGMVAEEGGSQEKDGYKQDSGTNTF